LSITIWFSVNYFTRAHQFESFKASEITLPDDIRTTLWKDTLKIFYDYPIFGSGLDTFKTLYPKYSSLNTTYSKANYAHNEYFQMLSDTGIVGFILFLLIISFSGRYLYLSYKSRKSNFFRSVGGAAAFGCIAFLIHCFFDFNLRIPSNFFLFSIILSIAFVSLKTSERDGKLDIGFVRK